MANTPDPLAPSTTGNLDLGTSQDSSQTYPDDNSSQYQNSDEEISLNNEEETELSEKDKIAARAAIEAAMKAILVKKMDLTDAIEDVIAEGYSREEAEVAVKIAADYINSHPDEVSKAQSNGGVGTLIFGILCLTAGILLTVYAVNNAIWYGAIIVGIIGIVRGLINMGKN